MRDVDTMDSVKLPCGTLCELNAVCYSVVVHKQ